MIPRWLPLTLILALLGIAFVARELLIWAVYG